ncbi:hypothetical protein [Streptomyces sp. NPDC002685]|uniref:hypothetical protein n=1 Tax=Streptomyces sp. NPDC002685 TaxID=3154540 RepID=UPI00332EA165
MLYDTVLPGVETPYESCRACGAQFMCSSGADRKALQDALNGSEQELRSYLKAHHAQIRHLKEKCKLKDVRPAFIINALDPQEALRWEAQARLTLKEPPLPDSPTDQPD